MYLSQPTSGGVIDFNPFLVRTEDDPTHEMGAIIQLNDGRQFNHAKVGASAIAKGKLSLAPAPIANHANIAVAAAAASGATSVRLTPGATGGAAGIYDEGTMHVNDVTGEGQYYKISHNPAITSSTEFTLSLADQIAVALTTSSQVTLVHNRFNGVVEAAVATRRAAGVCLANAPAAGDFVFLQTKGEGSVLADGAIAVGNAIVPSDSVAGAVEQQDVFVNATDATRLDAKVVVGRASIFAGVDTEYPPVVLSID